mgnify:CR=1
IFKDFVEKALYRDDFEEYTNFRKKLGFSLQTDFMKNLRIKHRPYNSTNILVFQQNEYGNTIMLYYKKLEINKNEY